MLIEDKRKNEKVPFKNIAIGECFTPLDTTYVVMRIPLVNDAYNAIYLDDGTVEHFGNEEKVIRVKAKVVIE